MAGKNRYFAPSGHLSEDLKKIASRRRKADVPCVFVSHNSRDKNAARVVSKWLRQAELDVWFDESDQDLQAAVASGDVERVVLSIQRGLTGSTHALCLLSEHTRTSWWVPYELGYAQRGRAQLATLLLRSVEPADVPEFLQVIPVLEDQRQLSRWLIESTGGRARLEHEMEKTSFATWLTLGQHVRSIHS